MGAKQIHSNDNKNDGIQQQLKLDLTTIRESLASIEKQLETILNYIIALQENYMANSQGPSAAPVVRNLLFFCLSTSPNFFYLFILW